ncbi:MAG: Protein of unknown function metallopeptidase-related protein [Anaerocolumna sp.]|jgi:predicted metal-dependent peptidase|nr:Protein of unknown function metallopeptidase-related protein [Anaerocolumna sp.]
MDKNFDNQVTRLYEKAKNIITGYLKTNHKKDKSKVNIPDDFRNEFFRLIDKVNLNLMEDQDNFFGYFLFQMAREIRFDISSPTAVNFKGTQYVIYFNPVIFLTLSVKQMETTIKHEILHIVSMHLIRAKELKNRYSTLAMNIAMDIVVNKYLNYLPPYATTLEWVNLSLSLNLEPAEPFEYYVEKIQTAIHLLEEDDKAAEDDSYQDENNQVNNTQDDNTQDENTEDDQIEMDYNIEKTHNIWEDSSDIDEKAMVEFTEKAISYSEKGEIPSYLKSMILGLKNSKGELPWNLYLKRIMGTVSSNPKKTITRRDRRQPDRLDLRGQLRSHKANILVALDISGSISEEEFKQAMKEVLSIVKNSNHEITVIECDNQIRRVYKVKSDRDLKERINKKGATRYNPVFEYANQKKVNLLIYFTDGKGEDKLQVIPRGYGVLWIISGGGDRLSLKEPYGAVKKLSNIRKKDILLDVSDVASGGYSMNNQERIL